MVERGEAEGLLERGARPRVYLDMFWAAVDGASKTKRLSILRAMGGIKIVREYAKPGKRKAAMRKHFTFTLLDFEPEAVCFVCAGPWHHRHHIINIQNGGGNSRKNVVPLCRSCHKAVHGRTI